MSKSGAEIPPPENVVPVDLQVLPEQNSQATKPESESERHGDVKHVDSAASSRTKASSGRSYQLRLGLALAMPVFLETLDYTVVATAQPHIASAFNRLDLQSYIGTIYVLTSTVFLPIFASLADIFGRHWALQLSMFFFLLGSAISTGARNITMVLAGRAIAGIGAAGLITVVRVIIADSRSLNANNTQTAIIIILYAIGYSVGPVIGGALITVSFRWVFAINLPCTAVSMVLAFVLLRGYVKPAQVRQVVENSSDTPEYIAEESFISKFQRVDVVGVFLFIGGGILILLGLNWGSTTVWNDARVIATLVIGGILSVAFVLWEWFAELPLNDEQEGDNTSSNEAEKAEVRRPSPALLRRRPYWFRPETMIPLEVFKNYDTCVTQFAAFASGMVMLVNFYFLAIFFTIVLNKSANQAGVQLVYFAPGMGVGTFISIYVIKVFRQPKYAIILGGFIIPVGLGLLSFAMERNNQSLADAFLAVCGVGVGLGFGPLATQARFSQPESRVAIVVGLNLFFRTFGGTVGLAQCSAVMNAKVRTILTDLAFSGTFTPSELAQIASLGDISSIQSISQLPPFLQVAVRDAFREGVRWAFISLIPWTGVSAILVLFLSNIPDSDLRALQGGTRNSTSRQDNDNDDEGAQAQDPHGTGAVASRIRMRPKPKFYQPISLLIWYIIRYYKERQERRREVQVRASVTAQQPASEAGLAT